MTNDLRYAVRMLAKAPLFSLVCVLSLGFGIGSASTMFHWMDRILWRPLAGVEEQHRLVGLVNRNAAREWISSSDLDYRDLRDRAQTLRGVAAHRWQPVFIGAPGETSRAYAQSVSGNYFEVLGVRPALGRTFSPEEQTEAPATVAVLAENYWIRHFARDPGIVGRVIQVNRQPLRVIGIAPAGFVGTIPGLEFDLWIPLSANALVMGRSLMDDRGNRPLSLFARLAPEATVAQANAEIAGLAQTLAREYPGTNQGIQADAVPIGEHPDGAQRVMREPLYALAALGVVILLLVCANVGNLLLARAQGRRQEFAVRRALGAATGHLARQIAAESGVLAAAGALLGLLMAIWMGASLRLLGPATDLPLRIEASFNGRLVAIALTASLAAMLLASLAPLWRSRSADLRESSRGASDGRRLLRWRGGLAITEIAFATVALIGALVFWRSLQQARAHRPGFDPAGVVLLGLDPIERRRPAAEALLSLERARQHFARLPGVESAALVQHVPLGLDLGSWEAIAVPGYTPRRDEALNIWRNIVSDGYFDLLRIPFVEGRDFRDTEAGDVAIVNETFARRYYAGRPALGQTFSLSGGRVQPRIIGVVKDSKYQTLGEAPKPFFYLPLRQRISATSGYALMLRGRGGPLLDLVQRQSGAVDSGYGVIGPVMFETYLGGAYIVQRAAAGVFSVLGSVAVLLAAMGIYGVMMFAAHSRRREIGIRMAVGATPGQALRLLMSEGWRLAGAGIAAGLLLWTALGPLVRAIVFGVGVLDPLSLAGAASVLLTVLGAATLLPAARAVRADPGAALRDTA